MDNPQELKKAVLSALAEKGDYGTILKHLSQQEKNESDNAIARPFSAIADMLMQNSKGVFMEELSQQLEETTSKALEDIKAGVETAKTQLELQLKNLLTEGKEQISKENLENYRQAENRLAEKMLLQAIEIVALKAEELLPELKESGKLTDSEIDDIIEQSALSVESQITRIIGEYLGEHDITASQIVDFKEEVQKLIPAVDFSTIRLNASQINDLPQGGTSAVLVQRMIDASLEGFTGGSSITFQEEDGSPAGTFDTIKVTNGTLTDNGDGSASLNIPPPGGGEANTASNVGTAGVGVFKQKTAANLEFKKLNAGSSKVTITDDTGNDEVDIDVNPANINTADLNDDGTFAQASHTHTLSDVTDSGALAALNTVGTAQIDNDAVTFDKIQNIATARVLARSTAGTGSVEALTLPDFRTLINVEDGADVTDTANVTAAGALMDSEVTNLAAVKAFDPADYLTPATAASTYQPLDADLTAIAAANNGSVLAATTASFTTADEAKLDAITGTNTGDEADASTTVKGIIEIATQTEVNAGTDTVRAVTPATLANYSGLGGGGGTNTYFNNQYIDQSGGTSDTYGVLSGTINGSNTTFTVSQGVYATGTLTVYQNGKLVLQGTGAGWTETTPASGTFDFVVAPRTGDEITVAYQTQTLSSDTVITDATTDVSTSAWVVDEDNMASDSATKVPTQQSVKAYVDANAGGGPLVKPSTDHTISGNNFTSAIVAGETISTVVQSVQVNTAGKWGLTNATTVAGGNSTTLGITVATASTDAAIEVFMGPCIVRDDSFPFTAGDTIYLNTTSGSWTATAPSSTGNVVRKVGRCIDTGYVLFDPEDNYLTVA